MQNNKFRPEKYPIVVQVIDQYLTAYSPDFDFRVAEPYRPADVGQTEMMIIKVRREIASRLNREANPREPRTAKSVLEIEARDTLTPREAARLLRVSEMTIRRMCEGGTLTFSTTPGGHRRIMRASLEAYLESKSAKNTAEPASSPQLDC